jgi:hypothetical protein
LSKNIRKFKEGFKKEKEIYRNSLYFTLPIMLRDVLGNQRTDELLSDLEPFIIQLQTLGWKEMRPWGEFFATFKAPQFNSKNLEQRLVTNILYYRSNYIALCAGILILQVLFAPMILVSAAAIFALYTYLTQIHKGSFRLGDLVLDNNGKRYLFLILAAFILIASGTLYKILWAIVYSIFLCGLHMVFRPRNVQSKANRAYEEMKLSGANVFDFMPTSLYEDSKKNEPIGRSSSGNMNDLEDPSMESESKGDGFGSMRKRHGNYGSKYND